MLAHINREKDHVIIPKHKTQTEAVAESIAVYHSKQATTKEQKQQTFSLGMLHFNKQIRKENSQYQIYF